MVYEFHKKMVITVLYFWGVWLCIISKHWTIKIHQLCSQSYQRSLGESGVMLPSSPSTIYYFGQDQTPLLLHMILCRFMDILWTGLDPLDPDKKWSRWSRWPAPVSIPQKYGAAVTVFISFYRKFKYYNLSSE